MSVLSLRLKTFNYKLLVKYIFYLKLKNIKFSCISLPKSKKKFTILTSPHVNKKARIQYEILTYNCIIYILEDISFIPVINGIFYKIRYIL
jgi:ribosomal protein S10